MIGRLFVWMFFACRHKWKIISKNVCQQEGKPIGAVIVLQCEKCGNVKQKMVGPN